MSKLTPREIDLLVNYYIGCHPAGYLGVITEPEDLRAFFQVYCDLDINPASTHALQVRNEFVELLNAQSPQVQAKIVRTVLESMPIGIRSAPHTRNSQLRKKMIDVVERLESSTMLVDDVAPESSPDVVRLALRDAEYLIGRGDARGAVAKTHTALHGQLTRMCDEENIAYGDNPSLPKLFKLLRENHSAFQSSGSHQEKIDNVAKGLSTAIHSLNEIRNQASDAHPNAELLGVVDATLAINAMRTIFHYVEERRSPRGQNLVQRLFSRN